MFIGVATDAIDCSGLKSPGFIITSQVPTSIKVFQILIVNVKIPDLIGMYDA